MKNIEASVRARLANMARRKGVTLQRLLTLYMQEGLLHRITRTAYRDNLVLKGGLLLYVRYGTEARTTKDIDLHARDIECDTDTIRHLLASAASITIDDGLTFDVESVRANPIRGQEGVVGVRGHVRGHLGTARGDLQVDVGCGDVITRGPRVIVYPSLLEGDSFRMPIYSVETVIAEKLSALVSIGVTNSRIRDLYDMYVILVKERQDDRFVVDATVNTFRNRRIPTPETPEVLTDGHWSSREFSSYWTAYLRRLGQSEPTIADLQRELLPVLQDIYDQTRGRLRDCPNHPRIAADENPEPG